MYLKLYYLTWAVYGQPTKYRLIGYTACWLKSLNTQDKKTIHDNLVVITFMQNRDVTKITL